MSRQAFNDWRRKRAGGPADTELDEEALVAEMRKIHDESDAATYGQLRLTPELHERGFEVNHKRVEHLMRVHGIIGVHRAPKVRTAIPAADDPPMPDLIGRRFAPGAPGELSHPSFAIPDGRTRRR